MDLFTLFLQSIFQYGVGKSIDVMYECFKCKQKENIKIGNSQYNHIECKNCTTYNNQFTNACDVTINKRTKEIVQGAIGSGSSHWHWQKRKLFGGPYDLILPHNLRLIGLQGRTIVLKTTVKGFQNQRNVIADCSSVITPNSNNYLLTNVEHKYWNDLFWAFKENVLYVKSELLTENKKLIADNERVVQYK